MAPMTEKRRFLETLLGNGADRFPYFDLEPAEGTLTRWRQEGLPASCSPAEYFRLETHESVGLILRSYPFFEKADDLLTDPHAFERHYDPDDPARYMGTDEAGRLQSRRENRVLYVDASGGGLLQMLGVGCWNSLLTACLTMIENPGKVERLLQKTTAFYCVCLERVLSEFPVDYASFYEPIASNTGPVISPAMFERYALPVYRKVLALLDAHHVPLRILCTTGGDLSSLLGPLIDSGINGLWISNIQSAAMSYQTLRQRFGTGIALIGGIPSGALSQDSTTLEKTVRETALPLLEGGHYLPCLDDRPRSHISFVHYAQYRRILADMAQKG